jgi:hypothetical protein
MKSQPEVRTSAEAKEKNMARNRVLVVGLVLIALLALVAVFHPALKSMASGGPEINAPIPAPTAVDTQGCLKSCLGSYNACENNICAKIKNLQDKAKCQNHCLSNWNCCQDICYGKRKTCP